MKKRIAQYQAEVSVLSSASIVRHSTGGEVLVELKDVNVSYHERKASIPGFGLPITEHKFLRSCKTQTGQYGQMKGGTSRDQTVCLNCFSCGCSLSDQSYRVGSGKTTLLSLLTGDHPQSHTQRAPSSLNLFGKNRNKWATVQLKKEIGIAGMDVLNAWPRGRKMTVWDVVATGFDGGFISLGSKRVGNGLGEEEQQERVERVDEILRKWWEVQPHQRGEDLDTYAKRNFADLPVGEQSLVIVLRALVGKPKLVLLDEAWSGMDADTVKAVHAFLRSSGSWACEISSFLG
jgi:ABC-type molybdenum transport system ATPase subunit/photorepair protein PhrA